MKNRFQLNNNKFYDSYINDNLGYNTDIELILVELPIFRRKNGDSGSVGTKAYLNMNDWFAEIDYHIQKHGVNTLYLYEITTTPVMYDPNTFLPSYKFIVRQSFKYEE